MVVQLVKNFDAKASLKDADSKSGIVTGYLASFGNEDSDGDVIIRGAFKNTINLIGPTSSQPRIKHLLDHNTRQAIGKFLILKEDEKGLYYESQIGSHQLGQDFLKMCESGLITEHSIGYRIIKGEMDETKNVYQLLELGLYEGSSLQFWGANSETPYLGMKSEGDMINTLLVAERELRKGNYSDEAFVLIQKHVDNLNLAIKSRKTTDGDPTEGKEEPKQPEQTEVADLSEIKSFLQSQPSFI